MRWANYSHSALCYSLRDWFAAMRNWMYWLVKLQIVHFLGISWFYCYCCWTFLNCKKCGHIFKGWCAGDLFFSFWALISGRASVVQATRPDLGQKLGEVFGSSLLHGLSPFSQILFSLVFFPPQCLVCSNHHELSWLYVWWNFMEARGCILKWWECGICVTRSSKWMLETSLPHIPTAEENLPAPLSNDWWTVCCFGITLNTKQQNAESDQHLRSAQKCNVEKLICWM